MRPGYSFHVICQTNVFVMGGSRLHFPVFAMLCFAEERRLVSILSLSALPSKPSSSFYKGPPLSLFIDSESHPMSDVSAPSNVWSFFIKTEREAKKVSKCQLCFFELSGALAGNAKKHLQTRHGTVLSDIVGIVPRMPMRTRIRELTLEVV